MRRLVLLSWISLACTEELPERARVTRLRVLAIQAAAPSLRPDATTELVALVADPAGAGRPLATSWTACVDPAGDDPSRCLEREDAWTQQGDFRTVLRIPERARPDGDAVVGVVLHVCAGAILEGAVPPVCGFVDSELDGEDELAAKRLLVSEAPDNANPQIEAITLGGDEVPGDRDGLSIPACSEDCPRYRLLVQPTDESDETFRTESGVVRRESLLVAFASDGGTLADSFASGKDLSTDFVPDPGAGRTRFWIVLHDERGGVDFRTFVVETR